MSEASPHQPSPHQLLHPSHWKAASGYANGFAASGRQVFIGGQIGWNAQQVFETRDLVEQIRQTLDNIVTILAEADGRPEHLVRLTWYVKDKHEYLRRLREVGGAYRSVLGKHFPAMTMVQVADLVEDDAQVEIEATAVIPD
ncbi:RidA family protein [Natronospirillum operosum]|uniref:RidA family protein n=1 Tax=Natronospirillum operosum TaxID=2759953 RepID=A0A4Z0WEL2_9GAMM|nr:RidA family protein [Natronospirillum operosum]TGG93371.1 RidA family protein [Natronospirillum operosum]